MKTQPLELICTTHSRTVNTFSMGRRGINGSRVLDRLMEHRAWPCVTEPEEMKGNTVGFPVVTPALPVSLHLMDRLSGG